MPSDGDSEERYADRLSRSTNSHPGADAMDAIAWGTREVEMPGRSPGAAQVGAIEAPLRWSDLAVSTVGASTSSSTHPSAASDRCGEMISRVTSALGAWPAEAGHLVGEEQRLAFESCGHLQGATGLHEEHQPMFATATSPRPITAEGHLRMVAAAQPFISGGGVKDPQPAARRHCR